jgi:hypothetical protein
MEPKTQKPTVVRNVHFHPAGETETAPQAAIVVAVHSDTSVTLVAWTSGGTQHVETQVEYSETHTADRSRWTWPPRA